MNEKAKYLVKNVILFTISSFIPKILSFLLIPLYTNYLSTGEYGVFDLIITTSSLLVPIFTLDIQDAVMRFAMDNKYKKEDIFSTALKINLVGFVLITILTFVIYKLNVFEFELYFYIFLIIFYATTAISNSLNLFCKGIEKVKCLVVGTIINSIITLSMNILFLTVFKYGIIGYLIANSIGTVISIIYIFVSSRAYKYVKKVENRKIFKEMISFSFPLIFNVIAWWINNASDRYIITWMLGVSVSGLYAISYKIPNLLSTFQNVFAQAWSISAVKEFDKDDKDGFIGKMYTMMNFSMGLLCSIIMSFNVFIAHILYSGEFFEAWKFVPPLLISVVFNAMSLFIGSIFTAVKDTKTLSISTIIGALTNIVLNIILIRYYGAYGAAIATMIGYLVVLIMRNIILKKHIKMKTNQFINSLTYVLLMAQMVLAYFGNKFIYIQIIITISIMMLYRKSIASLLNMVLKKIKKKKI